jgi:hypothetical protein
MRPLKSTFIKNVLVGSLIVAVAAPVFARNPFLRPDPSTLVVEVKQNKAATVKQPVKQIVINKSAIIHDPILRQAAKVEFETDWLLTRGVPADAVIKGEFNGKYLYASASTDRHFFLKESVLKAYLAIYKVKVKKTVDG